MKNTAVFILLVLFSLTAFAQKPGRAKRPANYAAKGVANEKDELEKAVALVDSTERIAALKKFVEAFPKSKEKTRALELIVSTRAALADERLRAGDAAGGIELFKLAVADAPVPVADKLYNEVVVQIPTSLYVRGEQRAAIEVAKLIEEKAVGDAKQTLALAAFYLGTENASEAKRLAERAAALAPELPSAYLLLGVANRLNFSLEEAVAAYQKALELDANSVVSKRSLAEMKRAVGKPAEAAALYREILSKDETDAAARTGLILALFDADNRAEAESELQKSLDANPNNLFLLTGAAYWYAAKGDGARAVELAQKAVAVEPRYTWAQIALARGFIVQKRFAEAEKPLLAARQYGNFPTLDYEIASALASAGFYREAAEGLRKNFAVKDNLIETRLGNRVRASAKTFTELLALERRASIFQTAAADNAETAERLKSLLDFYQKLDASADENAIAAAADEFVKGDDKMKLHRELFAASQMLERRKNLPKVLELSRAAIGAVDAALDQPDAAAAVLADELYESRKLANARGEIILVPEVSRQTLSAIVRGRIEEIAGWSLYQTGNTADAVVRLKRAVSVLPAKSAWWRNATWRLGSALEADGKSKDALDQYIKSYASGEANGLRYGIVESLYRKVNGSTDGLEAKIGAKPAALIANQPAQIETTATAVAEPSPEPKTEEKPIATPEIKLEEKPIVPETKPEEKPLPSPETKSPPAPEVSPSPEIKPEEKPLETKPEAAKSDETETPKTEVKTETKAEPKPTETEIKIEPKPIETGAKPVEESAPKPLFEPVIINVPKVETTKKPTAETDSPKTEIKQAETVAAEEKNSEKNLADAAGETRPRVVIENQLEKVVSPCRIAAGQETISLVNNGGNMSVLVRIEGETEAKEIKATSSSPADVEVVYEPEFGAPPSNRQYFGVASISRKTGEFKITFEAACGKKEITVRVR